MFTVTVESGKWHTIIFKAEDLSHVYEILKMVFRYTDEIREVKIEQGEGKQEEGEEE